MKPHTSRSSAKAVSYTHLDVYKRQEALFNGTFELTDGEGAPLDAELLSGEKGVQPIDGGGWGVRFSAVWAVPDASPLPQTLAVSYHDASGAQLLCMPLERGGT